MTTYFLTFSILVIVLFSIWMLLKSSNWIAIDGFIKKKEIIEKYNRPDFEMLENRESFDCIIDVKYSYNLNSKKYTGTN